MDTKYLSIMEALNMLGENTQTRQGVKSAIIKGMIQGREGLLYGDHGVKTYFVPESAVLGAKEWGSNKASIVKVIDNFSIENVEENNRVNFKRRVGNRISHLKVDFGCEESRWFTHPLINKSELHLLEKIMNEEIEKEFPEDYISRTEAACYLGISNRSLDIATKSGYIDFKICGNAKAYSMKDLQAYKKKIYDYIDLREILIDTTKEYNTSFDSSNQIHVDAAVSWLKRTELSIYIFKRKETGTLGNRSDAYCIPTAQKDYFIDKLGIFILRFGNVEERYYRAMQDPFWKSHPGFNKMYKKFGSTKQTNVSVALAEVLISGAHLMDIPDLSDQDAEKLVMYARTFPEAVYGNITVNFLNFCKNNSKCGWSATFATNRNTNKIIIDTSPYSKSEYYTAAAMTFNDELIKKEHLIEKV